MQQCEMLPACREAKSPLRGDPHPRRHDAAEGRAQRGPSPLRLPSFCRFPVTILIGATVHHQVLLEINTLRGSVLFAVSRQSSPLPDDADKSAFHGKKNEHWVC